MKPDHIQRQLVEEVASLLPYNDALRRKLRGERLSIRETRRVIMLGTQEQVKHLYAWSFQLDRTISKLNETHAAIKMAVETTRQLTSGFYMEQAMPKCTLIRGISAGDFAPERLTEEERQPGFERECGRPARRGMYTDDKFLDEYVCEACFEDMVASGSPRDALELIWRVLQ